MGYLLPALTGEKFENQRDVVLNERRQQYENRPYGMALMALMAALFPPTHPYHWTTIGETADLEAATLDEAHAFFRTFYHPGNASLTLAGDVETGPALERVRHHFDEIPSGPPIPPVIAGVEQVTPVTPISGAPDDIRLVLEDRVELPRLYLAWRTPQLFAQGDAGMDILAEMLTGGKTSRLYRTLVHERRIATDINAAQGSRELAGWFCITATAAPGHEVDELEQAVSEALTDLATAGPDTQEIERCRTQVEAQFVYSLQTVGGFNGRSDQLNAYNVYTGDPGFMAQDRARYRETTADQLRELAATQLAAGDRVALSVVPHGAADRALPGSTVARVS